MVAEQVRELVLVRHGESVGNVADARARDRGAGRLELDTRDPDTPLSDRGVDQARVLARHVRSMGSQERPEVLLSSPYRRAADTAKVVAEAVELDLSFDERLRERDLGAFDGLTGRGIRTSHPEEAQRRERLGKFYYRPPGGESWTDVAQRVRQVLGDLGREHPDRRVWVFSHQAVIMCFRLVLDGLDEHRLLEVDRNEPLANCSVTTYRRGDDDRALHLVRFGDASHVEASDVEQTREEVPEPEGGRDGATPARDALAGGAPDRSRGAGAGVGRDRDGH